MKGIVLAGGTGSRLWPMTLSVSKQLLPVYDKPMIYYPISTLMLAGIREILIITSPRDLPHFEALLGDGSNLGITFKYEIQIEPKGLAQAFMIGERFLASDSCLMILGDNIFHGAGLGRDITSVLPNAGAHIFTYKVSNPSDYGILEIDSNSKPKSVIEKPVKFTSNLAITGLYFFDYQVTDFAKSVTPSQRGEVEITSVLERYLELDQLSFSQLSRGSVWLDTGNPNNLNDAAEYVRIIENRTGLKIACLEEIAYINGWIDAKQLERTIERLKSNDYADYLTSILTENFRPQNF
jgi:glucose-1-phosphate thymidylyltransferase